ncbi:MAG: sulfotransferase domain-containing protein [Microcoleaceae cyanobacterium]
MKPQFLILGAQKAGTNSLYHALCQHPQILPATEKEVHFFTLNYEKGLGWYQSQFPVSAEGRLLVSGEGTPYYLFHPCVPQRVSQDFPNIKLIVLLRNPVERAISHYYMEVKLGYESLPLEEAIAQETHRLQGEAEQLLAHPSHYSYSHQHYSYLARGIYADQLQAWFRYFPQHQFLILDSQTFYTQPAKTLDQVFRFLGVPSYRLSYHKKYNAGNYPAVAFRMRQHLTDYFKPHNQRLKMLLGQVFSWDIESE